MIYGIEGQFGSGKSSLATKLAYKVAIKSAKDIAKKLSKSGNIVLSNIKMNEKEINNYFYFEDDKFLEILRTANLVNDLERLLYGYTDKTSSLIKWKRNKFSKFYIFFDEAGAIMNNRESKKMDNTISEYINQNRKNFEDIYIVTADGNQTDKSLRRFVEWWYYIVPFMNFPVLRNIGAVRKMKKDDDGKPLMKSFPAKDEQGDWIVKQAPVDEHVFYFWKPGVWNLYDDLHKNIKDPQKYSLANIDLVKDIIKLKPELKTPFEAKIIPLLSNNNEEKQSI